MTARDGVPQVEVVIFDAGLTLLHARPSFLHVFAEAVRRAGADIDPDDVAAAGDAFRELWQSHGEEWERAGELSPHLGDEAAERRFWRGLYLRLLEHLEVPGDHRDIAAAVHAAFLRPESWQIFEEVEDVLDDLERRGVRLAIISNWGRALRGILRALALLERFETVIVSAEERIEKPDLAIFDRALERLGELPGPHIAYVGDDLRHDVQPARRIGLCAVLVDRHDRHPEHRGARVSDLRQLPEVLPLPDRVPA